MRSGILCCLLVGCTFDSPTPSGSGAPDGMIDDEPSSAAPGCHGTLPVTRVCLATEPTAPLSLSGTIDTDTADCRPTRNTGAAGNCVLAGTSVAIGALRVVGPRPLVIVATIAEIKVTGDIDVASHYGGTTGAGAAAGACQPGTAATNSGGGQGGSLGFKGGNGGNSSGGPAGGIASPPVALGSTLRGGCAGAAGQGAGAGIGGAGGGAIALVSGARIEIAAKINASGAGGAPGTAGSGGGGGGGSGGLIVLDTPDLRLSGRLFANGGGGGGAGDGDSAGLRGGDPTDIVMGTGGIGSQGGGRGGNGSLGGAGANGANGSDGGRGEEDVAGGGGGGGAAGLILTSDTSPPTTNVSPAFR